MAVRTLRTRKVIGETPEWAFWAIPPTACAYDACRAWGNRPHKDVETEQNPRVWNVPRVGS
jgi:hypothetical protein